MKDDQVLESCLMAGLLRLNLDLAPHLFLDYLRLLDIWNRAYNLTAIQTQQERIGRHILDSLAILPWIKGPRIIDVGTGAGLPGIPLAIACPDKAFVLLDSNGKKTRFLYEVKRTLRLPNIEIVQMRVENYRPAQGFDTVVSRAFSELKQMIAWTHHLRAETGIWLAMKGRYPDTELSEIEGQIKVHTYHVPEVEGERCCVIIKR